MNLGGKKPFKKRVRRLNFQPGTTVFKSLEHSRELNYKGTMTEILETFEIDDPHAFEVLNNPLRVRILRRLGKARSVKEVAEHLGMPVTRLYYHFSLLEEMGLIRVVETRKVGAMLEKRYLVTAYNFRPSKKLTDGGLDPEKLAQVGTSVILDSARLDSEAALTRHFTALAEGSESAIDDEGSLGRTIAYMTPERAKEFSERIHKMLGEMTDRDRPEEGTEYGFSYVFFPIAGAERNEEE